MEPEHVEDLVAVDHLPDQVHTLRRRARIAVALGLRMCRHVADHDEGDAHQRGRHAHDGRPPPPRQAAPGSRRVSPPSASPPRGALKCVRPNRITLLRSRMPPWRTPPDPLVQPHARPWQPAYSKSGRIASPETRQFENVFSEPRHAAAAVSPARGPREPGGTAVFPVARGVLKESLLLQARREIHHPILDGAVLKNLAQLG